MEHEESHNFVPFSRRFADGQVLFQSIQNASASDPGFADDVKKALDLFLNVSRWVQEASLFSSNEQLEDISTTSLK
jgi:hypothetical protein